MKKNNMFIFIKNKWKDILLYVIFIATVESIFFIGYSDYVSQQDAIILQKAIKQQQEIFKEKEFVLVKAKIRQMKEKGCARISINHRNIVLENDEIKKTDFPFFNLRCLGWNIIHLKKPDVLKTLYFTSYSAGNKNKINLLLDIIKKTEINSVVIDIKEVDGEVAFNMDKFNFEIKPESRNIFSVDKLIKKLHQNNIYVIGRIVVFKDKYLAYKRPDLAVKELDKVSVWKDKKGHQYLDPNSKEVWKYTKNLARAIYLSGFDEVNFDYIRFPSDGRIGETYFPFSQKTIDKDNKWGRAKVLDSFFNYLTSELKEEFPEIELSGDLFGYTTLNNDDLGIGQVLEDGLLYFDRIAPMTYPSHYNQNFIGLNTADSHPYEVIKYTMKKVNEKINKINQEIELAKKENRKIKIRNGFEAKIDTNKVYKITKDKVMIWLQGFSCLWCKPWHIDYGREEIQAQSLAAKEEGYNSWFVWNAASRYKIGNFLENKLDK